MKRLLTLSLVLLAWSCARAPVADTRVHVTEHEPPTSVDSDVAAQNRINSFMYVAVMPKLIPCWGRLQDKGEIVFKYTYHRSGNNWVWTGDEVESSRLSKDQEAIALQCMSDAARDTSLPMEAAEASKGDDLVIHWEWPVPFPSDTTTLARISGNSLTLPQGRCVKCECTSGPDSGTVCECQNAHSGYSPPCTVDADKKGCLVFKPFCLSGAMGGLKGGVVARRVP